MYKFTLYRLKREWILWTWVNWTNHKLISICLPIKIPISVKKWIEHGKKNAKKKKKKISHYIHFCTCSIIIFITGIHEMKMTQWYPSSSLHHNHFSIIGFKFQPIAKVSNICWVKEKNENCLFYFDRLNEEILWKEKKKYINYIFTIYILVFFFFLETFRNWYETEWNEMRKMVHCCNCK